MKEWEAHPRGVQGIAWLADGRLVTTGRDRKLTSWKPEGSRDRDFAELPEIGLRVAVSSDQARAFAGDLSGQLAAFSIADGKAIGVAETNPPKLEKRLERAEKLLAERAAAHGAADDALLRARKEVEQALAVVAAAEKMAKERVEAAEKTREEFTAAEAEAKRWREELDFSRRQRPN